MFFLDSLEVLFTDVILILKLDTLFNTCLFWYSVVNDLPGIVEYSCKEDLLFKSYFKKTRNVARLCRLEKQTWKLQIKFCVNKICKIL